ncbi:glycosyltransferase [Dysgonomonas sp. ZJ279]|uniref:glycosyltransferase n=1 Tax=Dysgonomonas sp. ZJ279 TaxID=2709796 RepID=UPI0013EDCD0C|nr:glycosyltransferase [Dysgonomonas sp. ZJ279]
MKNVYIIDQYISSQYNGIGKFLSQVIYIFKHIPEINITVIEFNSLEKEFTIRKEKDVDYILFPQFNINYLNERSSVACQLLRLYIRDSADNIFFINHSPCENLVESLKNLFPLSKVVFIIHDLSWTAPLLGDVPQLMKILREQKNNDSKIVEDIKKTKQIFDQVDRIISLSKQTSNVLEKIYKISTDKIYYMSNYLIDSYKNILTREKNKLKEKYYIDGKEKVIIAVGRLTIPKGVPQLLNSFEKVLKKYSSCRLILVGNMFSPEEIFKLSKQFSSKITFTGQISHNELEKLYRIADIGVIPSYTEQCSYTGIEMLMHGLPIVASDGFGMQEMFQNDINARVAKIGNRKNKKEYEVNLTNSILELLFSDELCLRLSAGARMSYHRKYSVSHSIPSYSGLLVNL